MHRIGARAERRVTTELVNAFKRVQGKEGLLFRVADAALARPDDSVRRVVFPVVGEDNLRNLVAEYKSSRPAYRRTVQTTYRASYTNHYRAGLIKQLEVLQFRSEDSHQPVLEAVRLVRRYAAAPQLTYYPEGETIPVHGGFSGDWQGRECPVEGADAAAGDGVQVAVDQGDAHAGHRRGCRRAVRAASPGRSRAGTGR